MTSFINNDTVNNITYLNYFNSVTNGEQALSGGPSSNRQNFLNAFKTRHGSSSIIAVANENRMNLFFANSLLENKINKTASSSNYRFNVQHIINSFSFLSNTTINSSNLTDTTAIQVAGPSYSAASSDFLNAFEYSVITNNCVIHSGFPEGTSGNLSTTSSGLITYGYLADSVFSGNQVNRSLFSLTIKAGVTTTAFRVSAENQTTQRTILTTGNAQYPITCALDTGDGTIPGANLWATDLWLRDSPSEYAVGRIPHLLLCKTNTLVLGQLVKINTTIDGITNQKVWLVAANYGSDKLLMRVYTEGIS